MPARTTDADLMALARAIAAGDSTSAIRLLTRSPALASARFEVGATRQIERPYYLEEIGRHLYAGDTGLHIAAAAYRTDLLHELLVRGANVRAKNRRGAEPLHVAVSGQPGSARRNPSAQAATIACLIDAGADPDAVNQDGVAPLHIAARTRCAAAVGALLAGGADVQRKNKNGSTPMWLATHSTGRGGSGSAEAKAEQAEIVRLLQQYGACAP
ncbi:MAG: ankyrin repeat domain-containing protein [Chloroflexi bacterium]|nr:ankyrin repeat domain-containing protein [Chloroflexota bacterium]